MSSEIVYTSIFQFGSEFFSTSSIESYQSDQNLDNHLIEHPSLDEAFSQEFILKEMTKIHQNCKKIFQETPNDILKEITLDAKDPKQVKNRIFCVNKKGRLFIAVTKSSKTKSDIVEKFMEDVTNVASFYEDLSENNCKNSILKYLEDKLSYRGKKGNYIADVIGFTGRMIDENDLNGEVERISLLGNGEDGQPRGNVRLLRGIFAALIVILLIFIVTIFIGIILTVIFGIYFDEKDKIN